MFQSITLRRREKHFGSRNGGELELDREAQPIDVNQTRRLLPSRFKPQLDLVSVKNE